MPFASAKQERWMRANHPAIAARWTSEFGTFKGGGSQHFKASPKSESSETWKRGVQTQPKLPGVKRDFAHLTPSQSARHKPASKSTPNEKEAMQEPPGLELMHGSRGSELGVAKRKPGLRGRDERMAESALPADHRIL